MTTWSPASALHREEAPLARDALELVLAAILEDQPRACNQILHRAGHQHLARLGARGDASTDIHRYPRELLADDLALACMQARSHLQAEIAHAEIDRACAADGADRAVEGSEETIAGRIQLSAAESIQLRANGHMMTPDEIRPRPVTQLRSPRGRADDIREQNRCKHRIRLGLAPDTLGESDDLVREPLRQPKECVGTSDLHTAGIRDPLCDVLG